MNPRDTSAALLPPASVTASASWSLFEAPIGWIGLCGSSAGVSRTLIGYASPGALVQRIEELDDAPQEEDWQPELRERLVRYLSGSPDDFSDVRVAARWTTPFQQQVVAQLRRVPYGETVSYRELAERAGRPKAARAVGQVMATNPVPLLVPCHRVLASGGRMGGFSAPTGLELKLKLLEMEAAGRTGRLN